MIKKLNKLKPFCKSNQIQKYKDLHLLLFRILKPTINLHKDHVFQFATNALLHLCIIIFYSFSFSLSLIFNLKYPINVGK